MTRPPVVLDHLTKTFGPRRGIGDVTLTVEEGQVVGFLGPNGAGKSTTIRCLLGLYHPTSGQARVLGHDPTDAGRGFLSDVGYIPGELRLPESLSGADVLDRCARIRGLTGTTCRDELVERFGAEVDRPLKVLSKGNKQKLGIILAFMHRPRLLVLDEPTSGLDPLLRGEFTALVRRTVDEGRTVFLSSHDLDEVQQLADRVAIIKEGRLVANDTVDSLRAASPHTIEVDFDHDVDTRPLTRLPNISVVAAGPRHATLTYTGPAAPVLDVLTPLRPVALIARRAGLEELFLRLYGGETDEH